MSSFPKKAFDAAKPKPGHHDEKMTRLSRTSNSCLSMAFMGMASLGKMPFSKEHKLRSKAYASTDGASYITLK